MKEQVKQELFDSGKGADFSECGKYRYRLWRIWNNESPLAMCIGLNPSTANVEKPDPTITNLTTALTSLGYGGFYMMNCWPFITSDPKLLRISTVSDRQNIEVITETAALCTTIIFAWGNFKVIREMEKDRMFSRMFPKAMCFGKNKNGTPMHPLALMYNGTVKSPKLVQYESKES